MDSGVLLPAGFGALAAGAVLAGTSVTVVSVADGGGALGCALKGLPGT